MPKSDIRSRHYSKVDSKIISDASSGRVRVASLADQGVLLQLLKTMRPKQWTKNLVVFAAILFTKNLFNMPILLRVTFGFVIFCLLASSIYIINDVLDIEEDKYHPKKCNRPLASGSLSKSTAIGAAGWLMIASLGGSFLLGLRFGLVAAAYFIVFILYSFFLKKIVIVDVSVLSSAYVFRAVAGAVVINVEISPWLILCTILLALFLGLSKRRHEMILLEDNATNHRKILEEYDPKLLDQMIGVVTSSTVMAYSLYTFGSETALKTHNLMLTIPFVIFGIFRYLYLVYHKNMGGSPERILLEDKPLIANIVLWIIMVLVVLYTS